MKKLLFLSLFLLSCSRELVATTDRSFADGIEGTWSVSGTLDDGGFSWFVEYRFEGDEYWKSGYPPISENGTYELSGDTILFTSSDEVASMQTYKLSEDGQTLDISGLSFTYVKENP
jgi:hypothetical protein